MWQDFRRLAIVMSCCTKRTDSQSISRVLSSKRHTISNRIAYVLKDQRSIVRAYTPRKNCLARRIFSLCNQEQIALFDFPDLDRSKMLLPRIGYIEREPV